MKTESAQRDPRIRTLPAIGFALVMLFISVQSANAQWTPPSSSPTPNTNIYYNAGNVGVGTTTPLAVLDVRSANKATDSFGNLSVTSTDAEAINKGGQITLGGLYSTTLSGDSRLADFATIAGRKENGTENNYAGYLALGTLPAGGANTERMRIDSSGNVGIGTTGPYWKLTVNDPTVGYNSDAGNIAITNSSDTTKRLLFGIDTSLGANGSGFIQSVRSGTSVTPLLLNATGGDVGIGTTNPGYKLDVNGNTNVTGNLNITANGTGTGNIIAAGTINAKYQDVAEWVPSSQLLAAGTVVVLDSTKSNQVTSSSVSYDTRVAGVVSEQPGIALGEKSDSKVLVATTGRVKVKVDASKGAIHIGDLLVTSDVPGMAMRSEPIMIGGRQFHAPGTLIGKALEPLEKGKGEILVLLSLQ